MTEETKGLLLEVRWAPVTSNMGFLEWDAERAAHAYAEWWGGLLAPRGGTVAARPVSGSLEQVLSALLPLTRGEHEWAILCFQQAVHPGPGPGALLMENGTGGESPCFHGSRVGWEVGDRPAVVMGM